MGSGTNNGVRLQHWGLTPLLWPGTRRGSRVPAWRQEARRRVVAAYFPPEEQVALYAALGMRYPNRVWCIIGAAVR